MLQLEHQWVLSLHVQYPGQAWQLGTAGSLHPGGCQVSLADASVRFLSETTARTTRLNLARIADRGVTAKW